MSLLTENHIFSKNVAVEVLEHNRKNTLCCVTPLKMM